MKRLVMVLQSVVLPGKVFTNVSLQIKDECAMMVIGSTPWKMCHLSRFTPKQQTWNVVLHLRTWLFFSMNPCNILSEESDIFTWISPSSSMHAHFPRDTFFFGRRGPGTFEEGPPTQKPMRRCTVTLCLAGCQQRFLWESDSEMMFGYRIFFICVIIYIYIWKLIKWIFWSEFLSHSLRSCGEKTRFYKTCSATLCVSHSLISLRQNRRRCRFRKRQLLRRIFVCRRKASCEPTGGVSWQVRKIIIGNCVPLRF